HERFEQIADSLTHFQLQRLDPDEVEITADEVVSELEGATSNLFFLGFYSRAGIETALQEYGILDLLARRGFAGIRVWMDVRDPFQQRVRFYYDEKEDAEHLLAEIVAREANFKSAPAFETDWPGVGRTFRMVVLDWLTLRNPLRGFTEDKPRLPGQDHPGLEIGEEVMELLIQMARRLERDGLVNFPDHYHNAFLYARNFRYFSPFTQGRVMAVARDAGAETLARISWAIEWGCLLDGRTGRSVPWSEFRGEQILPIAPLLGEYFERPDYWERAERAAEEASFRFDWERYDAVLAEKRAKGDREVPSP
ncbi:MAG: hypothetical protein K8I02_13730, partial [Candidatus Methylomirabilis sp.]|nr:hypothetical protein [Deltaproteobacteria bacterium]